MADENTNQNQELRSELAEQNEGAKAAEPEQIKMSDVERKLAESVGELDQNVPEAVEEAKAEVAAHPDQEARITIDLLKDPKLGLGQYVDNNLDLARQAPPADNLEAQTDSAQKAQDQLRRLQELDQALAEFNPKIIDNLQREIADLMGDGELDAIKAQAIREKLLAVKAPPEAVDKLLSKLAEGASSEQINAAVKELVEENIEVAIGMAGEVKSIKGLLERVNQAWEEEDLKDLLGPTSQATEKFLNELNMPGFIDLVFATGYSSGSYGSRYEGWGEEKEEKNEKKTLAVLKTVFDSEKGSELFLAKLTKVSPGGKIDDQQRIEALERLLDEFRDNDSEEAKAEIKKRFSEAVEKAGEAEDIKGIKLDKEKVNLSPDVVKFLVLATKKRAEKNKEQK